MSSDESNQPVEEPKAEEPKAQAPSESEAEAHGESAKAATRQSLPPADFHTLVTMLSTQAMVGMGVIPHPATGKPTPHTELARHFIDLLGVVEAKTRGNLDAQESRLLDGSLHDLRMGFVELMRRGPKPAE